MRGKPTRPKPALPKERVCRGDGMRLAGVCTMNRRRRPRRQVDTAELLRLRQEGLLVA